ETGALQTAENIKRASILAMYAGADYIKTSTGKIDPAATPEAALVMCQAIKEYHAETGTLIGFKAAGGIKTVADAVDFYTIVSETLGEDYIKQGHFRIGTSRLANLLVSDILGEDVKPF
ncbi:MAG: deoxyribose-phosphate aldolase, partial [Alloprevotella sp.]